MDEQITINKIALNEIKKKILSLIEGVEELVISSTKTVYFAEGEGWSDKSYYDFQAKYLEASSKILEGVRICDEELIPKIKSLESLFEED